MTVDPFGPDPTAEPVSVEGLGEPTAIPYPSAPDVDPLAAPDERRQRLVERIIPLVQLPFTIAPIPLGRGLPPPARDELASVWRVSESEARPTAEAIARILPETELVERMAALSPWLAIAVQLQAMVSVRLGETRRIVERVNDDVESRQRAAAADSGTGARAGGNGAAMARNAERDAAAPPASDPGGWSSDGLGLRDPV